MPINPVDQLISAEAAPAPAQPTVDPVAALEQADRADTQVNQALVGEHAVTQEQDGYRTQIAASKPDLMHTPSPTGPDDDSEGMALGTGTQHVLAGAYKGIVTTVGELANATLSLATLNTPQMLWEAYASRSSDPVMQQTAQRNADRLANVQRSVRAGIEASTPDVNSPEGTAAKGITQFVAAFVPISRALEVANVASLPLRIGATAAAAGAAQAAAFNPSDERMSNLVQSFPSLKNPLMGYLASKPGDTEWDGRLHNFIEGSTAGVLTDTALEGFMSVAKGMRAAGAIADTTKAVADAQSTAIDHVSPQAPLTAEQHAVVADQAAAMRISRKEGHRFTISRSMVSRHVGPLLVKQDLLNFPSRTIIRQ